jgi:outer membrane protein OmpA-like peptidoglycan-associated protein
VRGFSGIETYDDSRLQDQDADLGVFLDALAEVPGIIVTSSVKIGDRYVVSGFRDPLTQDPNAILASLSLDPARFDQRWEAYQALGEGFILERALQMLEPPDTVTMTLEGKTLVAKGEAPHVWIMNATRKAPSILGLEKIEFSGLIDAELKNIHASVAKIEEFRVYFKTNSIDLADGQEGLIEQIAEELKNLHTLATGAAIDYTVQLMGHADSTGTAQRNMELSQRRAQQTRALLAGAGIKDPRVHVLGVGVEAPLQAEVAADDLRFNRAVSFYVDLVDMN